MASATGLTQKNKQTPKSIVDFDKGIPESAERDAIFGNPKVMASMAAFGKSKAGTGRKREDVKASNVWQLDRPAEVRVVTSQDVRSTELRVEEMRKLELLAKQGFEQSSRELAKSLQQSQEQIGKQMSERFTALKSTMDSLNKNIVASDEKGKQQFRQLQHRILETENQINAYREKIRDLFKDMNTKDEAAFKAAKLKLEEYNALINGLAENLTKEIKEMDAKLNGQLRDLSDKLHDLDMAINAGFERAQRAIELEKMQLKNLMLREFDPGKLRDLERRWKDLEKDNEDIEIYVCLVCGGTNHGPGCAAAQNVNNRKRYKIKRRQLERLKAMTTVGANNYAGEAFFVDAGGGSTKQEIVANMERIMRGAGIAI